MSRKYLYTSIVSFTIFLLLVLFNTHFLSAAETAFGLNLQNRTALGLSIKKRIISMAHSQNTSKIPNTNRTYSTTVTKNEDKYKDPLHITGSPYSVETPIRPFMEMATRDDSVSRDDRSSTPNAITTSWHEINDSDILSLGLPKITLLGPAPLALEVGANCMDTELQNADPSDFKSILTSTIFFFRLRISYGDKISFNW